MQQPNHAVEINSLRKAYGKVVAVEHLDLAIEPGTCQGLLGPNGAGKSTTINILVGLLGADSGQVRLLGLDWAKHGPEIRQHIGVQLQETQFSDKLRVEEVLTLFRSFYREGREPEEVLQLVGLVDKRAEMCLALSGGQKQRLALGTALVNRPRILFLDEPTTGLDPQARRRVWEIIDNYKAEGTTVLLTTHYMDEAEQLCDQIVIIDHGRSIAEGSPQQIIDSLQAQSFVEFSIVGAQETGSFEDLPGVRHQSVKDGRFRLAVTEVAKVLPVLMERIRSRGAELEDLHTHKPTLEDVFVSLTGRHLRDG